MEKVGLYPGCSLKGSSREYGESVVALARVLGLPLEEIKDWNCCGASSAHAVSKELSLALPARVLSLAAAQGYKELLVPCAACFSRLKTTQHTLMGDDERRKKIEDIIGAEVGGVKILSVMEWLEKYAIDAIKEKMNHPIKARVACYYGCLLVRPSGVIKGDRVEDPQSLDNLVKLAGATPIDWAFKTECCGGGMSIAATETVGKLSAAVMEDATHRGAKAIIVACPMCHSNLDMRRPYINKNMEKATDVPVLYITQLLGMACGLTAEEVSVGRHFVNYKEEEICQK
ncbi:MAG: CoB--CoM heterodisulfide reductase iron-sulfur subunit B family protein [Flavobacteriales bacterium]|nr:CoB--CoM heterodisulfide reductase iron-sulfur subunit B family protein [Flavobacteriales bacterium]